MSKWMPVPVTTSSCSATRAVGTMPGLRRVFQRAEDRISSLSIGPYLLGLTGVMESTSLVFVLLGLLFSTVRSVTCSTKMRLNPSGTAAAETRSKALAKRHVVARPAHAVSCARRTRSRFRCTWLPQTAGLSFRRKLMLRTTHRHSE